MTVVAAQALPTGTWNADATHSSINFSVKHMAISTFRSGFDDVDAGVTVGEDGAAVLVGTARAASIRLADENLAVHVASAEFFDSEAHPEITFRSTSLDRDEDRLDVDGSLTIKGITRPVKASGAVTDVIEDPYGGSRFALTLQTTVDRREFGLEWNAPLPKGGFALGNDVTLEIVLELVKAG